jgi:hypothetical protein
MTNQKIKICFFKAILHIQIGSINNLAYYTYVFVLTGKL